jgi:hypothetical protein
MRLRAWGRVGVVVAGMLVAVAAAVGGIATVPGSAGTSAAATSPVQFTTCGSSLWTVPTGVTSVTADVFGAPGGSSSALSGGTPGTGGAGAEALGTFAVTPGDVLQINVGCAGGSAVGHTPGLGGRGGDNDANGGDGVAGSDFSPFTASGGGGGASDVRQGGTALSDRVVVGGGGGGAGDAGDSGTGSTGGAGGFPSGLPGGGTGAPPSSCNGGGGGTQSGGGAGGAISNWCSIAGTTAVGPSGADGVSTGVFASGGGGGGYNGGGSGATMHCSSGPTGGGAGGGGAAFFATNVTNQFSATGDPTGDGLVELTFVVQADPEDAQERDARHDDRDVREPPIVPRFTC